MGEINEALGIGDKFLIDGVDYLAHIATFEELEDIDNKTKGLWLQDKGIRLNFLKLSDEKDNKNRDERIKKLLALLQAIFPDAPAEKIKKMDRRQMAKAIDYFLID
jgi:hypothetical protein